MAFGLLSNGRSDWKKRVMEKDKPRLSRLTAILTQLQSKRIVTSKEIAEKHHISIRTVYRDIRTLEKSGIPIITEEGKGYSIMEGYKLPPVMFTQDEANALITAEQIIRKNKDQSLTEFFESAITKIKSVLNYSQKDKVELLSGRIHVRNNRENEKTSKHLIQLQSAISNYQATIIDYRSLENKQSQRKIEPFALYTTQDNWILIAFCNLRNDLRAFRLDCIQKIEVLEDQFEPHKMTLEGYLKNVSEKYKYTPDIHLTQDKITFAPNQKNTKMQTVKIEPFKIIGISVRTTNQNGQAAKELSELWGKFLSEGLLAKIPNKVDTNIYSLYTDYESDHTKPYTAILGCKVEAFDNIPSGMVGKSFNGGTYFKTTAKGDIMKGLLVNQWSKIFEMELDRTYDADFEIYGEKARNPSDSEIDFYVGIK